MVCGCVMVCSGVWSVEGAVCGSAADGVSK